MPLVRVRILLGKSVLGEPLRPFAPDVSVLVVVDQALEMHQGVELNDAVNVFKDAEEKVRTAQLPMECLANITVGELLSSGYGTNLVIHIQSIATAAGAGMTTPSAKKGVQSLPDSLQSMMTRDQELVLPPRATGSYLKHTDATCDLLHDLHR